MENLTNKTSIKVTIGVLIVFIGFCILSSTYYNEKKFEVFDDMNDLYYEQLIEIDNNIEELADGDEIVSDSLSDPSDENVVNEISNQEVQNVVVPTIDYTKYYVGYLSIPKIGLKKGFTEIDSKYNNVNRNIQVISPSSYPNVEKGNFIIAGHSGSSSVSFFKDLYKLSLGDEVGITYNNQEYKYTIKNIYTDIKDGDIGIKRNKDKTTLTLITCTKGDKTTQTIYICELV